MHMPASAVSSTLRPQVRGVVWFVNEAVSRLKRAGDGAILSWPEESCAEKYEG